VADGWRASCRASTCAAPAVEGTDACWAHATEDELAPALARLGQGGPLVAREVAFGVERLLLVLGALPRDEVGRAALHGADFTGTTFATGVSFARLRFAADVTFQDATFEGDASFDGCTFAGTSWFTRTTFGESVTFERTGFTGTVVFDKARFVQAAFTGATFDSHASFQDAAFRVHGELRDARFGADLTFAGARAGTLAFDGVTFAAATNFAGASAATEMGFAGCTFTTTRQLGRVTSPILVLADSTWHERTVVEAVADRVVATGARFPAGVQLRVGRAEVTLEGADFGTPSILTSLDPRPIELARLEQIAGEPAGPGEPPCLVSLARADVAGLTLSGVDLAACDLAGVHHLSQLRIDGCTFAGTPDAWWRSRRRVIVEEVQWRAARGTSGRSRSAWAQLLPRTEAEEARRGPALPELRVTADQVASVYRELRKGREEAKDEPGAADFYYGEMEMRRLATSARHRRFSNRSAVGAAGEHLIITTYWFVSGYGLRAWRSFAALGALLAAATFLFASWGIEDEARADLAHGALASARAAAVGVDDAGVALTTFGAWLQLAVRLLGPVLLGLALLALRGRVRR
jgi:uncharacterized protein YjbI with pentapeptide repeats